MYDYFDRIVLLNYHNNGNNSHFFCVSFCPTAFRDGQDNGYSGAVDKGHAENNGEEDDEENYGDKGDDEDDSD